ncbi:hypothetical protein QAD02_020470 [Eretmocerus hayati]|uniref:Uncharacterized protein n=1 Tax=Eretmocerus hayati TaxID=131215 RepID=A0ACC2PMM2_9HYME|nr:hypothetical protein QAD02_020470 [Eretmocerus hayati]
MSPPAPARTVLNHVFFAKEALRTGTHCFGVTPKLSPLVILRKFHIIKSFVPEPMHQTSGGTGKQLTKSILDALKPAQIEFMNQYLDAIRVPTQLGRFTRSFTLPNMLHY